jgi:hypothetical protein
VDNDGAFFFQATANQEYALEKDYSKIFTLNLAKGSPRIASIHLPSANDDAEKYSISYLVNQKWSQPQIKDNNSKISVPNVSGLRIVLLDSRGAQVTESGDFTFYVTFQSNGAVSGSIAGDDHL